MAEPPAEAISDLPALRRAESPSHRPSTSISVEPAATVLPQAPFSVAARASIPFRAPPTPRLTRWVWMPPAPASRRIAPSTPLPTSNTSGTSNASFENEAGNNILRANVTMTSGTHTNSLAGKLTLTGIIAACQTNRPLEFPGAGDTDFPVASIMENLGPFP